MLFLKSLLTLLGAGLLLGAAGLLVHDLYQIVRKGKEGEPTVEPAPPRWNLATRLAAIALIPLLVAMGILVVPGDHAAVRISQFGGAVPGTLYPGVHFVLPLIEHVELYSIRDAVYMTVASEDPKKTVEMLRVQTKEGLPVGLAVAVRYRLDPSKLYSIYMNLPHPVDKEIVPPVVSSTFREVTPNYMVQEIFATRREQIRGEVAGRIVKKLAADGIVVKEVMLRDVQLPAEYAKGLEGLLLKEQENERLGVELDVKSKLVKAAELEAEAQKMREVKQAEGAAMVVVLQAKAQADAMQHTLPLKEKQIQQQRLEAEARAQAKVIDARANMENSKMVAESEEYRIRRLASADAERMKLEAAVLKENPLVIQKIIAERLSDKVQIVMVPNDGKFFFTNDVFKGMASAQR